MASTTSSQFLPIRACIFDMDGLLINTEDIYSMCANNVLERHGRPHLPWSVKAKLMGVPGASHSEVFHEWAQLPIPREQWKSELLEQQMLHFPECKPLPGVAALLMNLKTAKTVTGKRIHVALATSAKTPDFVSKTTDPEIQKMFEVFDTNRRVLGDDSRIEKGRGKPAPDIFLMALKCINDSLPDGESPVNPEECLVFEDSVLGVEAGRRASMRVVWVPHLALAAEYRGEEKDVLAGRVGLVAIGDEHQLGQVDDGWATSLPSLENFPYGDFGIEINP
ncbi:HAD-like domain-containing protein [Amylocarpus encephaloides]|uniref:HAD-like domain-containing protein n=1 Tax=Amylocarpus encephaloides TaxID=45428 RepID=A0A9P7YCM8_9HELO|nr:HAD-like domain-containing protein [Amylocarpus encephaloides]